MKTVLIVDDTKSIRTLLTTCLELNGYRTIAAKNGTEALEAFRANQIDLAFLDIKMPGLSGTEVLRKIRSFGIDIPVVIMTAFATVKNAVECTRLGAVAYLQKPFTADKVKAVLAELNCGVNDTLNSIERYIASAKELIAKQDLDEALKLLKTALSMDIECGEIYSLIGMVYELKGEIESANKFYIISKQFS